MVNIDDETTPLLGGRKDDFESMNGYSNSNSSISFYPAAATSTYPKCKFTNNHGFIDESSSLTLGTKAKLPSEALNNFARYQQKIGAEKRLIDKVCQDKDLTDLILNLHKFKVLYRKRITEETLNKSKQKQEKYQNLIPKQVSAPANDPEKMNLLEKLSALNKENRFNKKKVKDLERKINIIGNLFLQTNPLQGIFNKT